MRRGPRARRGTLTWTLILEMVITGPNEHRVGHDVAGPAGAILHIGIGEGASYGLHGGASVAPDDGIGDADRPVAANAGNKARCRIVCHRVVHEDPRCLWREKCD